MSEINFNRTFPNTFRGGGIPVLSTEEQEIQKINSCTLFFAPWLCPLESGGIRSFKNGVIAAPVDVGILPSWNTIAGPNGHPEYRALTNFPTGVLMTDAGMVGTSFTMETVFLANTSIFNVNAIGIVGNNGGGFGICLRSTNLLRLLTYPNANSTGIVSHAEITATTGLWHHVIARYDATAQQLRVWRNGVLMATIENLVLTFGTTRVALLGTHDLAGFASGGARTGRMALARVFNQAVSTDITDALIATARARFPVITWP
jgi:hypothetical protein